MSNPPLPNPTYSGSDAGQAAFFALRICRVWAAASRQEYERFQDVSADVAFLQTDDGAAGRLGEVLIGIVALERALLNARWVVANRPESAARFSVPGWDADELDAVQTIVKVRRDAVAHVEAWIHDRGEGHIGVSNDKLHITGLPDFGLQTWPMWAGELETWARSLLDYGYVAVRGPVVRPRQLDLSDTPDWFKGPRASAKGPAAPGR